MVVHSSVRVHRHLIWSGARTHIWLSKTLASAIYLSSVRHAIACNCMGFKVWVVDS